MALYEVKVKQTSTVYYEVEAPNADAAAEQFSRENFMCEFVDDEEVVEVRDYDDRFDDDEDYIAGPDEEDPDFDE